MSLPSDVPPPSSTPSATTPSSAQSQVDERTLERARLEEELQRQREEVARLREAAGRSRSKGEARRIEGAEIKLKYLESKLEHFDEPAEELPSIEEVLSQRERVYNYVGTTGKYRDVEVRQARNDLERAERAYRKIKYDDRSYERDPYGYELKVKAAERELAIAKEWYEFVRDTALPKVGTISMAQDQIKAAKEANLKHRYGEQSTFKKDVFEKVLAEEKQERAEERAAEREAIFSHYRAIDAQSGGAATRASFSVENIDGQIRTTATAINNKTVDDFAKSLTGDSEAKKTEEILLGSKTPEEVVQEVAAAKANEPVRSENIKAGAAASKLNTMINEINQGQIPSQKLSESEISTLEKAGVKDVRSIVQQVEYAAGRAGNSDDSYFAPKVGGGIIAHNTYEQKDDFGRVTSSVTIKPVDLTKEPSYPKPTDPITDFGKGAQAVGENIINAFKTIPVTLEETFDPKTRIRQSEYEKSIKFQAEPEGDLTGIGIEAAKQLITQGQVKIDAMSELNKIGANISANPAYAAGAISASAAAWLFPVGKVGAAAKGAAKAATTGVTKIIPEVERAIAKIALQGDVKLSTRAAIEAARPETSIFRYYPNFEKAPELRDIARTFEQTKPTKSGIVDVDEVIVTKEFERAPTNRFLEERRPEVLGQKQPITIDEELGMIKLDPSKPQKLPTLADIAKSKPVEMVKTEGAPIKQTGTEPYSYVKPTLGDIMKPDLFKEVSELDRQLAEAYRAEKSVPPNITPSGQKVKKLSDIIKEPSRVSEQEARLAQTARAEASAKPHLDDLIKKIDAESRRLRRRSEEPEKPKPQEPTGRETGSGLVLVEKEKDISKAIMNLGKKTKKKTEPEGSSPRGTGLTGYGATGAAAYESGTGYISIAYPPAANIDAYNKDMISRVDAMTNSILQNMTSIKPSTTIKPTTFDTVKSDSLISLNLDRATSQEINSRIDTMIKQITEQTSKPFVAEMSKHTTSGHSMERTHIDTNQVFQQKQFEQFKQTIKISSFMDMKYMFAKRKRDSDKDVEYSERLWNVAPVESLLFGHSGKKDKTSGFSAHEWNKWLGLGNVKFNKKFEPFTIDDSV